MQNPYSDVSFWFDSMGEVPEPDIPELPAETPTPTETVVPEGPVHTGDVPIEIVSILEECWVFDIMKIEIKTEPEAELHLEMFLNNGGRINKIILDNGIILFTEIPGIITLIEKKDQKYHCYGSNYR